MYVQLEGMSGVRGQITTLLLEAGADPNLQNNIGNTALHLAAKWDRMDSIPILVEHGASLEVENSRGETPLDVAVDDRIIELLTELSTG